MSALSFQEEWINKLLSGTKQQTTRPQTDRIMVGDIVHVYNQQRRRIKDKEVRTPTAEGIKVIFQMIDEGRYPKPDDLDTGEWTVNPYYAHFLGKVEISEVYDIHPCEMSGEDLESWARADGFYDRAQLGFTEMELADTWFRAHYRGYWMHKTWTVIRWDGWLERYFEPEA